MSSKPIKIRFVQFEPAAALSDDVSSSCSDAAFRAYWMIIFYLYCNGGKCRKDMKMLAGLSRCKNRSYFERVIWPQITLKFPEKAGYITHKRVTKELRHAKKYAQDKRRAGLASARARSTALQQRCNSVDGVFKEREREGNENEKEKESSLRKAKKSVKSVKSHFVSQLQLYESLVTTLHAHDEPTQSDQTAYRVFSGWAADKIKAGKVILAHVEDLAKEAATGKNPAAYFFAAVNRELGYVSKRRRKKSVGEI